MTVTVRIQPKEETNNFKLLSLDRIDTWIRSPAFGIGVLIMARVDYRCRWLYVAYFKYEDKEFLKLSIMHKVVELLVETLHLRTISEVLGG